MYNVSIPKISKEELNKRYARIKPIVELDGKKYLLRDFTEDELKKYVYTSNITQDKREIVDTDKYIPLEDYDFECLHEYGYYGIFKPTIAEVLAQIPEDLASLVEAFEIIEKPETIEDLMRNKIVFNNGFHISKVRLYCKKG